MNEFILPRAVIEVSGDDHISFLHRMSTQDIESLDDNASFYAAFASPKGRLVDVVYGFRQGPITRLASSHESATPLLNWLENYIIIDEVELRDQSDHMRLCVQTQGQQIKDVALTEAPLKGELEYEDFRVKAGIVSAPEEINDKYGPLELGLHDALHWAKGCYIGQEVISRIDNYQKQTKHLIGVSAQKKLSVGDEIYRDDKKVGVITSALDAHWANEHICALAIVRADLTTLTSPFVAGRDRVELTLHERPAQQTPKD